MNELTQSISTYVVSTVKPELVTPGTLIVGLRRSGKSHSLAEIAVQKLQLGRDVLCLAPTNIMIRSLQREILVKVGMLDARYYRYYDQTTHEVFGQSLSFRPIPESTTELANTIRSWVSQAFRNTTDLYSPIILIDELNLGDLQRIVSFNYSPAIPCIATSSTLDFDILQLTHVAYGHNPLFTRVLIVPNIYTCTEEIDNG